MKVIYPDLEGQKILVTGATRGIGKAIALSLGEQKANVLIHHRNESRDQAENVKIDVEKLGGQAELIEFDLSNAESLQTTIKNYLKEKGPIHGLVNNAGRSKDQLALRLKETDIDEILGINLKSAILLTSALTRGFLSCEHSSVVNMSSVAGLMGNPGQVSYAASKAGLIGFTKSYAKEMASKNIRCNAICPGLIATDMANALDDKRKELYLSQIPLNRLGEASEVAQLTCFLLSKASSYITGSVIKIDGGLYI